MIASLLSNARAADILIAGPAAGGAAIAASNSRLLFAWTASDEKLHVALTDFAGNVVAPVTAIASGWGTPAAAFDGQRFLVVTPVLFSSMQGIFVEEDGTAGVPFELESSASAIPPLLAWNGSEYVALLQNGTLPRVSPQGAISPAVCCCFCTARPE